MIHITQGHEKGIGLEVFFKACLRSSRINLDRLRLHANATEVEATLKTLSIPYSLNGDGITLGNRSLSCQFFKDSNYQSAVALESALSVIKENDTLVTLPTSKDQLPYKGAPCSGYTEYFRKRYSNNNIAMTFKGPRDLVLLISDHIALKDIPHYVTSQIIKEKISIVLNRYPHYFEEIEDVLISGINPHAGEGGILGGEEMDLLNSLKELKEEFSNIKFSEFLPGDTLHFHNASKQLKVYMFHDQGLPLFKRMNGTLGLNISLGLPFLRLSVDHGTAFSLYGKNKADSSGCFYVLQEAYRVDRNVHQ